MSDTPDLVLYHLYPSRSCRVLWLIKELGLDVKIVNIDFLSDKSATQDPGLLAINPAGKIPALRDGDACVAQSGACVMYLLEKYAGGKLQPPVSKPKERAAFLQHFFASEEDATDPACKMFWHGHQLPKEEQKQELWEDGKNKLTKQLELLEKDLEGKKYLINDEFTAADIMLGYSLLLCTMVDMVDKTKHENISAYFANLKERPGYKAAFNPDTA